MRAERKGGAFIGVGHGGHHLEEIVERIGFARQAGAGPLGAGEGREQFRDVVRDVPVLDPGSPERPAHEDVEVKVRGNAEAARAFQDGAVQRLLIEQLVAAGGISQEVAQGRGVGGAAAEGREDEIDVGRGQVKTAEGTDDCHKQFGKHCLRQLASVMAKQSGRQGNRRAVWPHSASLDKEHRLPAANRNQFPPFATCSPAEAGLRPRRRTVSSPRRRSGSGSLVGMIRSFVRRFRPAWLALAGLLAGTASPCLAEGQTNAPLSEHDKAVKGVHMPVGFRYEILVQGDIAEPVYLQFSPDGRLWFTGRRGDIWAYDFATKRHEAVARLEVNWQPTPGRESNERGLHGLAFDPGYRTNGYVYLHYAPVYGPNIWSNRVSRFTVNTPAARHGPGAGLGKGAARDSLDQGVPPGRGGGVQSV